MKAQSLPLTFILLLAIVVATCGCTSDETCNTQEYTKDGECCTYICDKTCPSGYIEGTCRCECKTTEEIEKPDEETDTLPDENTNPDPNIDDIFSDEDIDPPGIPE